MWGPDWQWFRKPQKTETSMAVADAIPMDAPIERADQDRLRRSDFAGRIAMILSTRVADEGRVFAIRGPWGSGKSSLKNLVIDKFGSLKGGPNWIDFNPWQWGDGDAITKALFREIANSLGGPLSSKASERAAKLRRYGSVLAGAAEPVSKIGGNGQILSLVLANASIVALATAVGLSLPSIATVAAILAIFSIATPIVGRILSSMGEDRWAEPLNMVRASLEDSLRGLEKPLVVFVDDIDRLEPEQIRVLLRQVKVNANLPNIVFVLIFQPSIVEAALDPIAGDDGRKFLEKIVQANFDLPVVPISVVHRLMTEELSELASAYATEQNGFAQVRWGNVLIGCIQPHIHTLRDARRFLASVAIHLPLHTTRSAFEVNIIDFFGLEALRVFEPDLYASMARERELLLQSSRFDGDGRDADAKQRVDTLLLAAVPEARREVATAALKEMFPALSGILGGSYYGNSWREEWIKAKRVCTARFLPRFFELQTPAGEISESEFVDFLAAASDEVALDTNLAGIRSRELLPSLVARLDESVSRIPVEHAERLLPCMFSVAQELVSHRATSVYDSAWVAAWRSISWYIKRVPEGERGALVLQAFRRTKALSVAAVLIHLNDPADRKDSDKKSFEPSFDSSTLAALKEQWLVEINRLASRPQDLLAHPDLGSLLYRWRDYTGNLEAPRKWVKKASQSPAGFAAVVASLMTTGTTHTWGDLVGSQRDTFNQETIEEFFGTTSAKKKVLATQGLELPPAHAHAVNVLSTHLEQWSLPTDQRDDDF